MREITDLQSIKIAFMKAILNYFVPIGHCSITEDKDHETFASMISFFESEWPAVEKSVRMQEICTGTCSDLTCHFVCELLAGRIEY
jgi:hypothetical protein